MIVFEQVNSCVLTDGNGNYITFQNHQPTITSNIETAYKWRSGKKANNFQRNLPAQLKSFNVEVYQDSTTKKLNKEILHNPRLLQSWQIEPLEAVQPQQIIDSLLTTDSENKLDSLKRRKRKIECAINDLKHYIEFGSFNAYEGSMCLILLKNFLEQRRELKNEIYTLNNIDNLTPSVIQCREYSPRVLKELFL